MSPRAASRLETLGFERVHDFVGGRADWLAYGRPRAGERAAVPYAGDLVDPDPPTCRLSDSVAEVRARLGGSGFCLVLDGAHVVLGRVRRSALDGAPPDATAEAVIEPGPRTVRPSEPARELAEQLAARDLRTVIVTTPEGFLLGVFDRASVTP